MAAPEQEVQPKPERKNNAKFDHPLAKLCWARVEIVIQEKGGNVIKGRAKWFRNGFIKLTEAEIIGTEHQVKVPWVIVEHHATEQTSE